ncbi:Glycine-rich protein [Capsicum annuum]|uniref:Glycine-rich protein n=1 Tax=Capsicum annuum TaxID=4072 RepID=A0A2G2ZTB9_CAPAN|nr:glycine-rich protein HC1 [Capsicum annuum]KAF3617918.1 Glycine-rich protein [Capsicum annuum]KAF3617988.1 Glycine-rich protein [Capsicum annuum]PHT85219.1 Glycine-rich protein [Capsicum annuum]
MMGSKAFLFLGLSLAIFVMISSEVVARELAETSKELDNKNVRQYRCGVNSGGSNNRLDDDYKSPHDDYNDRYRSPGYEPHDKYNNEYKSRHDGYKFAHGEYNNGNNLPHDKYKIPHEEYNNGYKFSSNGYNPDSEYKSPYAEYIH